MKFFENLLKKFLMWFAKRRVKKYTKGLSDDFRFDIDDLPLAPTAESIRDLSDETDSFLEGFNK